MHTSTLFKQPQLTEYHSYPSVKSTNYWERWRSKCLAPWAHVFGSKATMGRWRWTRCRDEKSPNDGEPLAEIFPATTPYLHYFIYDLSTLRLGADFSNPQGVKCQGPIRCVQVCRAHVRSIIIKGYLGPVAPLVTTADHSDTSTWGLSGGLPPVAHLGRGSGSSPLDLIYGMNICNEVSWVRTISLISLLRPRGHKMGSVVEFPCRGCLG